MADLEIVSSTIKSCGIRHVSFFNLGEPFLCHDVDEQLALLRRDNPTISISCSTNGVLLDSDAKREAALLLNHLYFSIHGSTQEEVERYQRKGNFASAYGNMKAMVDFRNSRGASLPRVQWNYVIFNWNDRRASLLRAVELAREAQIDLLEFRIAGSPFFGVSWRALLGRSLQGLGDASNCSETFGGRIIRFT